MDLSQIYNGEYYGYQVEESLCSARVVLPHLWRYLKPDSILDVGCGRGAWLKVCHELGSGVLFGLDGEWNNQSQMIDSAIRFKSIDLNGPFVVERRTDLAMSLEVAEHLEPASSHQFIECLCQASDSILFSAAYVGQGGTNHLTEQRHSYWAGLFRNNDYVPFDLFRPSLWDNEKVAFYYRQNAFLYCKRNSDSYRAIRALDCREMENASFMDCIHPKLYDLRRRTIDIGFKEHVSDIIPSFYRAVRRRCSRP